jgi:hypothetical protein
MATKLIYLKVSSKVRSVVNPYVIIQFAVLENHKSECLIGHKVAMETKLPGLGTCLPASGTGVPWQRLASA